MPAINLTTLTLDIDPDAEPIRVEVSFKLFDDGEVEITDALNLSNAKKLEPWPAYEAEIISQLHDITIDKTDWMIS